MIERLTKTNTRAIVGNKSNKTSSNRIGPNLFIAKYAIP